MAINDDSPSQKTLVRTMVDAGNSNKQFLQVIVLDETGVVEVVKSIDYDGTDYTPLGSISEYIQVGPQGEQGIQGPQGPQGPIGESNHGNLTGLGDDDHTQYLTEDRHDSLPSDNPHSVTAAQTGAYTTAETDTNISTAISNHVNEADPHPQYVKNSDLGWISVSSTASQSYNFNQRVKIPFTTGFSVLNTNGPAVSSTWFDSVNSKFTPDSSGDFYSLRFSVDVTANQGDKQVTLDLDIGGTQGIVWSTKIRTPKSGGETTKYTLAIPVFTLGTFVANGGEFYATFDTSGTVANANLVICKVFKA